LSLNREIPPRRLTDDEANQFGSAVGNFVLVEYTKAELVNGKGLFSIHEPSFISFNRIVKLESYTLDPESAAFGEQLLEILASRQYVVKQNALLTVTPFQAVETGIHIYGADKELAEAIAAAVPKRFGPTNEPPV